MIFFEICKFPRFLVDRYVVGVVNFVIRLRKWVFGVERGIMKAKIDKYGLLSVERKGEWKSQLCPCTMIPGDERFCGDWCPLFEEGTASELGISFVRLSCAPEGVFHDIVSDERAG